MKTKNNLTTGILLGIGVIVFPLILMGTTLSNTNYEPGNYQISTTGDIGENSLYVYETIIDTKDGKVISRKRIRDSRYVK